MGLTTFPPSGGGGGGGSARGPGVDPYGGVTVSVSSNSSNGSNFGAWVEYIASNPVATIVDRTYTVDSSGFDARVQIGLGPSGSVLPIWEYMTLGAGSSTNASITDHAIVPMLPVGVRISVRILNLSSTTTLTQTFGIVGVAVSSLVSK